MDTPQGRVAQAARFALLPTVALLHRSLGCRSRSTLPPCPQALMDDHHPGPLRHCRLTPPPPPCPQALMDDHHLAQWLSYEVINVYLNMLEQRMQDWGYYSTKQHPWQS